MLEGGLDSLGWCAGVGKCLGLEKEILTDERDVGEREFRVAYGRMPVVG